MLFRSKERAGNNRDLIRVTEQAGIIPGLTYRSQDWSRPYSATYTWRASMSYVVGAHNTKFGAVGNYYRNRTSSFTNNPRLTYRFNNGVPNQLTMSGLHFETDSNVTPVGLYAQEQWTLGRLTLQGGIRYDHVTSHYPDQQLGPELFIPEPIFYAAHRGISYNDISPRAGATYDLFGNGRTALRFTVGRYLEASSVAGIYSNLNPLNRLATSTLKLFSTLELTPRAQATILPVTGPGEKGETQNVSVGGATTGAAVETPGVTLIPCSVNELPPADRRSVL